MTEPASGSMTGSIEDYLKSIYALEQDGFPATTGRIAARLSVAPASVTGMVKRLEITDPPLAERRGREGVSLTEAGRRAALRTLRRHRLIEQFLVEVLSYNWDQVHQEAERLEHAVSPLFEERLSMLLGEPRFDPHGDPIPDAQLNLPPTPFVALLDLAAGESAVVRRITNDDPELLRYLATVALTPGSRITVVERTPLAGSIRLRTGPSVLALGDELAGRILVERTVPGKG